MEMSCKEWSGDFDDFLALDHSLGPSSGPVVQSFQKKSSPRWRLIRLEAGAGTPGIFNQRRISKILISQRALLEHLISVMSPVRKGHAAIAGSTSRNRRNQSEDHLS